MKNVSTEFKRQLHYGSKKYLSFADITLEDGTVINLTNAEIFMGGFSCEQAISSDNTFSALGSVIIGSASLIINNISGAYTQYDFTNATVVMQVGLTVNGVVEKVRLGTYRVDDAVYTESSIKLSMLDYMEQFDRPYTTNIQYPNTLNTILRDICTQCGVTLATPDFPHKSFSVSTMPLDNGTTFREVISWIASIAGCYAFCNDNGQLVLDWFDTSVLNQSIDLTVPQPDVNNLGYHYIHNLKSVQTIGIDDTVITGVSISVENENDPAELGIFENNAGTHVVTLNVQENVTIYTVGTEGYIIHIEGNDFITHSNVIEIINWLATQLIGLQFRKLNVQILSNPTIEVGDVAKVVDRKGNTYNSLITRSYFSVGSYQDIVCGADTPLKNSATRYSSATKSFLKSKKLLKSEQTLREQQIENLTNQLAVKSGMYTTIEASSGGGNIYYMHNKPTLAESSVVWKMTSSAWGVTTDYDHENPEDTVWNGGMTVDGDTITRILSAVGVNADWIETGEFSVTDSQGNETFYVNCDTGVVRINATSFSLTGSTVQQIAQEAADNLKIGGRNLLLNSSFTKDYNIWTGLHHEIVTQDGIKCGHVSGSFSTTKNVYQSIFNQIKNDDYLSQTYVVSADVKLVDYTGGSTNPFLALYFSGHYNNNGSSSWLGAIYTGGNLTNGDLRPLNNQGWKHVYFIVQFNKKPTTMGFHIYGRDFEGDLYYKNIKLERGTKATDWSPAPEDVQSNINTVTTIANNAVSTANSANTTAQQALDIASSAGGLVAYLDNDFQNIPTDESGNYTTFPECSSKITVFYNSNDVSAQCTYTTAVTTGVTGNWNNSTRTYTVTGLTADSGTVTITAAYNNTSLSKKFTVIKVRQGETGTSIPGEAGEPARSYLLDVTPKSVKMGENLAYTPSTISINSYYRDGVDVTQTNFEGYIFVEYYENGTWSQVSGCSVEGDSSLSFSLEHTSGNTVSYNNGTLSLPTTVSALRVKLKSENSISAVVLDQEEIIILVDVSSLTQAIIFDKLTDDGQGGHLEGIFMEGGKLYVNASYIKSGTLILGGSNNVRGELKVLAGNGSTEYVKLNYNGITAIKGEIGGWEINDHSIKRDKSDSTGSNKINTLIQCPSGPTSTVLAIGAEYKNGATDWTTAPFRVTALGKMYATRAEISGKITATSGKIGGWDITTNSLRNETEGTSNNILIGSTTNNVLSIGATWTSGADATDWSTGKFRVLKNGSMYATAGEIGSWKITSNSIRREEKDGADALLLCPTGATSTVLSIGAPTVSNSIKWAQAPFYVKGNGKLFTTGASINGTFEAKDGNQTVKIVNGIIYGYYGSTQSGLIDMSAYYSDSERVVAIKGNKRLHLQGGSEIWFEIGGAAMHFTSKSLLVSTKIEGELHDERGYSGRGYLPTGFYDDGTASGWVEVIIKDGIVR